MGRTPAAATYRAFCLLKIGEAIFFRYSTRKDAGLRRGKRESYSRSRIMSQCYEEICDHKREDWPCTLQKCWLNVSWGGKALHLSSSLSLTQFSKRSRGIYLNQLEEIMRATTKTVKQRWLTEQFHVLIFQQSNWSLLWGGRLLICISINLQTLGNWRVSINLSYITSSERQLTPIRFWGKYSTTKRTVVISCGILIRIKLIPLLLVLLTKTTAEHKKPFNRASLVVQRIENTRFNSIFFTFSWLN